MSKQSEIRRVVSSVLDQQGIVGYEFSITGSKHQRVRFEVYGRSYSYIFASTASDFRTVANTKAGIKRLVHAATGPSVPGAPADRPIYRSSPWASTSHVRRHASTRIAG